MRRDTNQSAASIKLNQLNCLFIHSKVSSNQQPIVFRHGDGGSDAFNLAILQKVRARYTINRSDNVQTRHAAPFGSMFNIGIRRRPRRRWHTHFPSCFLLSVRFVWRVFIYFGVGERARERRGQTNRGGFDTSGMVAAVCFVEQKRRAECCVTRVEWDKCWR